MNRYLYPTFKRPPTIYRESFRVGDRVKHRRIQNFKGEVVEIVTFHLHSIFVRWDGLDTLEQWQPKDLEHE